MTARKNLPVPFKDPVLSPELVQAIGILQSGKVPPEAISKRPGKGGKQFDYVKHTYATRLLLDGLGQYWSFDCLGWEVWNETITIGKDNRKVPSTNVAARCRLTVKIPVHYWGVDADNHPIPTAEPHFLERTVTETGVHEKMPSMPTAMSVASAVSRGFVRCTMRMFGIGLELYENEDIQITPKVAWTGLVRMAENAGHTKQWMDNTVWPIMKEKGITGDNLVDRYEQAFDIVANMIDSNLEDLPE